MANSDKNILITPNKNASGIPQISLTGFGASTVNISIPDSTVGTLQFSASQKKIFSIDADLSSNNQLSIGSSMSFSKLDVYQTGDLFLENRKIVLSGKGLKLPTVKPTISSSVKGKIAYDSSIKTLIVNNSTSWIPQGTKSYVENGLILYYDASRKDCYAGSGSVVYDISGSSNGSGEFTGSNNNVGFSTDRGGAFTFNGSNSYIEIQNSLNILRDFSAYTVEWFVRTSTANGSAEIFGNYGTGYTTDYLWISQKYGHYINASNPYYVAGSYGIEGHPLADAYTYHGAVTREYQTRQTVLYLNGFVNTTSTANTRIANGILYRIGIDVNSLSEPFGGNLYLIRVYNRALTPKEIQMNFESARSRVGL